MCGIWRNSRSSRNRMIVTFSGTFPCLSKFIWMPGDPAAFRSGTVRYVLWIHAAAWAITLVRSCVAGFAWYVALSRSTKIGKLLEYSRMCNSIIRPWPGLGNISEGLSTYTHACRDRKPSQPWTLSMTIKGNRRDTLVSADGWNNEFFKIVISL